MVRLLDPLEVKGVRLRNRIVMAPMQTSRATVNGEVTDRLINFYAKRASSLGLLIVEHCYISGSGRLSFKQLGINDDKSIDGLKKLAQKIHATKTPAVVQISHAGSVANKVVIGRTPSGPSKTKLAREMKKNEIEGVVDDFALASERAIKAGFDGVELHGAHGFLLNQFFSPLFNKREDVYGGSSENRMRFPLKVAKKVRKSIGGKLLVYRLGADDLTPKGTKIKDSAAFASRLVQFGVDVIDVSGGFCGSEPRQLRGVRGYFVPQASKIKREVDAPVIGVGGITEPEYADVLIRKGKVDLVAVGRALWKDPMWAEKAVEQLRGSKW